MTILERFARFTILIVFLANQIPFLVVETGGDHSSECCCFEIGSCNHSSQGAECHAVELSIKLRICSFAPNQEKASTPIVIVHLKYYLPSMPNFAMSISEKEIEYIDWTKMYSDLILPILDKPPNVQAQIKYSIS